MITISKPPTYKITLQYAPLNVITLVKRETGNINIKITLSKSPNLIKNSICRYLEHGHSGSICLHYIKYNNMNNRILVFIVKFRL